MYAHILDKGLQYEKWQPGHSHEVYIKAKSLIEEYSDSEDPTVAWARDVITEYERRDISNVLVGGRHTHRTVVFPDNMVDSFKPLLAARTSVRQFSDKPLTEAQVRELVQAALQAPSSCCRQTLKVYATVRESIAYKVASSFNGFTCFSESIPAFLLFCVDLRSYSFPGELFTPCYDTALAVENAALMATAMQMSLTQLAWNGKSESDKFVRDIFGIPKHEEIVVGSIIGYPASVPVKPARKSIDSALKVV
jgi:hypothetical protein